MNNFRMIISEFSWCNTCPNHSYFSIFQQRGPPYKCQVCTKVFVNRNRFNYHQKKKGACPGVPVAPKPHKYIGNRYYCIHKDCLPEGVELNVDIHPQYTNRTQVVKT